MRLAALAPRSGSHHVHRACHVPDRKPEAGSDRDRLQRLRQTAAGAGHRHHESRPLDALHGSSGSAIKYVLRGWRDDGKPASYDLSYGDVRVRSVATNIRDWNGGTERHGNSIFIFEIGSLCIAHLGHLHHTLTQQQLDEIGRIDAVMVPVDGSYTLDIDGMIEVLQALKAPLMLPMHYFSTYGLERFLERVGGKFPSHTTRPLRSSFRG
jgi:hypothetical protein